MANAKSGVHVMQLKPISVPKSLIDGCKFVKWDEDTAIGVPVILKVDKKGFFLYWTDQNGETELLEISSIRDTRTGKYAKTPKNDGKLKESINIGPQEVTLEDKTLTVVYGTDFVNVNFINFCTYSKEIAQEWTNEILKIAYNLLAINASVYTFLEKAHTKLFLMSDRDRKLPVKYIMKMFANHKDDRKKIEKALESCSLSSAKNDTISLEKFDMNTFFDFYKYLIGRNEVLEIFEKICGDHTFGDIKVMTVEQFVQFLNKEQRDPRLNEILYPYANRSRGMDLIEQYEPDIQIAQKGFLSFDGFLRYLMSDDNAIIPSEKFDLNSDMDQPLSHYFINSSHNTYLTGHQLTGRSSVEIYRQCLLGGCRCIELDCWNGRSDDEPIITHGYTVVTDVPLKEVLEAIAESAFKTSHYPVILSFENHCSNKQQLAKMAKYCRQIFGEMLLTEPLPSHPLKPGVPLPSPNLLLKKIIIKDKKEHKHSRRKSKNMASNHEESNISTATSFDEVRPENTNQASIGGSNKQQNQQQQSSSSTSQQKTTDLETNVNENHSNDMNSSSDLTNKNYSCDMEDPESGDSSSDDDDVMNEEQSISTDLPVAKETTDSPFIYRSEMSQLVIYVQPIQFRAFDMAEKRNRSFEVSSFDETQSTSLLKEQPVDFVNYNKRQLSRIYPRGTRVNSSNFLPQVFWNSGCQMVALNFQTLDLGMQLNLGIFEYNGRNGYLLKPDFMRRQDRRFDPFTESTVDGIIAGTVSIKIISGQFLSDKRVGTYVEVDMYGLPADTVRRKRTKIVPNNALNPIYDEEPFVFKKVVLPDLACLRIAAFEENGKFLGTRILPFVGLRPGYRHISLRSESMQPVTLQTLFVHITVKDYIPDGLSELADALANPIAYQVEKHAKQLLSLIDEGDDVGEEPYDTTVNKPNLAYCSDSRCGEEITTMINRQSSQAEISLHSSLMMKGDSINKMELNGASKPSSKVCSPTHKMSLIRQDTLNRKMRIDDDLNVEKLSSSLESNTALLDAEPIEKLKKTKNIQKICTKIDRDILTLQKRFEKLREKIKENYIQEEDKLTPFSDKNKKLNNISKSVKKIGSRKQPSNSDGKISETEWKIKIKELQKTFSINIFNSFMEQYKEEFKAFENRYEQLCIALDKAMEDSQNSQKQYLTSLHDKEVAALMKRLDLQNKEELTVLSKCHKDKNELARIKRELQQKLIDQAVQERQRLQILLDKRKIELVEKHKKQERKLQEEKKRMLEEKQQECNQKSEHMQAQFNQCGESFFVKMFGIEECQT
ncbi:1-phosphatidylinositol 4 [Dermatophagoides farinae]|uniref:1-phosphatidylinositol 4,5-bisphosphate phosphodiesterase n=1 Tax=Dermatophagoides farinae TaxID=6954 RepID=A0A9D4P8C9_DERFA|nr:1-phosphatidylinositol 4,5-bisphosphate phosphodiesterase classes I and II-like [Dermatophagoides farinae]KAH7646079.1 1-phosphatidylinositol 4 [Dermatophagoides farinae]